MYTDKDGKRIKNGNIVAMAISCNFDSYRGFYFSTMICKKKGRRLILEGANGWAYLKDLEKEELSVIDGDTELRKVSNCFYHLTRKQRKEDRGY